MAMQQYLREADGMIHGLMLGVAFGYWLHWHQTRRWFNSQFNEDVSRHRAKQALSEDAMSDEGSVIEWRE